MTQEQGHQQFSLPERLSTFLALKETNKRNELTKENHKASFYTQQVLCGILHDVNNFDD